jgi:hypothetical protein
MTTIIVLLGGLAGLTWVWHHRPDERQAVIATIAATGLGFQAVHALEHFVQIGAWAISPGRTPFLTPWATAGRDVLAVGGNVAIGEELLHLSGNVVFLAGLVALAVLASRSGEGRSRSLRLALLIQGLHVLEHAVLTATAALGGRALGVTTAFGLFEPGPLLWTYRPMAHFVLNAVATAFAIHATARFARATGLRMWGRAAALAHN